MRWVALLCATACGRFGFDPLGPDRSGSAQIDASQRDGSQRDGSQQVWQLVASKGIYANGNATTSMPLAATSTAGQLIVVAANSSVGATLTSLTDDAGNTYLQIPTSRADSSANNDTLEVWYAPDANAGAATITAQTAALYTLMVWQFDGAVGARVDMAAGLSNQAGSVDPISPPVTTASDNEIIVASMIVKGSVTAMAAGSLFTIDSTANANGFAHLTDSNVPAGTIQAIWQQQNASSYCSNAVAFTVAP
jgi:hypothetical protein